MGWKIVERKLGRAGGIKQQQARQKEWNRKYGADNWMVGYMINDKFITSEEAFDIIYYPSYVQHFRNHPEDLNELVSTAKSLRNPHAEATGGVDLQVPAIQRYLRENNLTLQGSALMDIGTWGNIHSHKLSVRLSPLQIKVVRDDKMTLEKYWQEKKVLVVWTD
ncbi:MAG: hypothetical protein LBU84_14100 [Prevotella sp.]|jgi:hypothetical protein|nr:hypothetical protein [Prevotella sp.]